MNVIQAVSTSTGNYEKTPVVSLLQNQINASDVVQLTDVQNSVLAGTNNVTDNIYLALTDDGNIVPALQENESGPVQFVVIQRQSEPTQGQLQDKSTDPVQSKSKNQVTDKLECGQCQTVCSSVLEFLKHKATHIARGSGLGCEVCSLTFSRTKSLHNHYRRKHKIYTESDKGIENNTDRDRKKTSRKTKTALSSSSNVQIAAYQEKPSNCSLKQAAVTGFSMKSDKILDEKKCDLSAPAFNEVPGVVHGNTDNTEIYTAVKVVTDSDSKDLVSVTLLEKQTQDGEAMDTANCQSDGDLVEMVDEHPNVKTEQKIILNQTEGIIANTDRVVADMETDLKNVPGIETQFTNSYQDVNDMSVSDKENTRVEIGMDNLQTDHIRNNNEDSAAAMINNLSTKQSSVKPDFVVEIDMPDFYFITIIEKGPRNRINGSKYHFQCLYCDLKLSWRNTICDHMKDKHRDILHTAPTLHIPKHHMDNKHKIIKMSEYIKMEKNQKKTKRMRGIETQDLPGNYTCRKCGKVFSCLRYFRRHDQLHRAEKNLLCSICVKSFKTLANLNQHMKSHKEKEAYKCRQCDFESTINIAIHAHRQIHKEGSALCDVCGQAYNDKSTLNKHKQVHDLSRPFACSFPGCTWRFKSKNRCVAHERAHTTKGEFECKICGYAFRHKHHLQRHETKVHNVTSDKKCTYTVLPVDYIDEGIIVTDNTKIVSMEPKPVQSEVSLIINDTNEGAVDEQFDLESAWQNGQLIIATDNAGNTINYEMTDMGMNVSYQTLISDGDGQQIDGQMVVIPHADGNQILYQHEEVTQTVCNNVNQTNR